MRFLARLKNTKIGKLIRRNIFLKSIIKFIYKAFMFPFTRKGVNVNIGDQGIYKLDYMFAFRDYEDFGNYHNAGYRRWIESCKNRKVVFDIGAHIGLYSIPASNAIVSDGIICAFEPSEANRRYLKRHLDYNNIQNVVIFPYIIGREKRKQQIFYESKDSNPMNSLHPKKNINRYLQVYREQISLDNFAEDFNITPDVIKVDVEGSECDVLKGARGVIARHKPVIFLSVHPKRLVLFKSSTNELKEVIDSLEYIIQDWDGGRVTEFEHKEYILTPA
jgi:FkbM family methyltransferase